MLSSSLIPPMSIKFSSLVPRYCFLLFSFYSTLIDHRELYVAHYCPHNFPWYCSVSLIHHPYISIVEPSFSFKPALPKWRVRNPRWSDNGPVHKKGALASTIEPTVKKTKSKNTIILVYKMNPTDLGKKTRQKKICPSMIINVIKPHLQRPLWS